MWHEIVVRLAKADCFRTECINVGKNCCARLWFAIEHIECSVRNCTAVSYSWADQNLCRFQEMGSIMFDYLLENIMSLNTKCQQLNMEADPGLVFLVCVWIVDTIVQRCRAVITAKRYMTKYWAFKKLSMKISFFNFSVAIENSFPSSITSKNLVDNRCQIVLKLGTSMKSVIQANSHRNIYRGIKHWTDFGVLYFLMAE